MRISQLPLEKWDPELRQLTQADKASGLQNEGGAMLAHAPHIPKGMIAFMAKAMGEGTLSRRLVEIVRLRVAFHNQCRPCMTMRYQSAVDDGLTEATVCSLEKPEEAANLSERDKAALAYADLFATNHLAIGDETFNDLRRHYTEAEIIELAGFVAFFVGFGRLGAVLNAHAELPKEFQDLSRRVAPWELQQGVIVPG